MRQLKLNRKLTAVAAASAVLLLAAVIVVAQQAAKAPAEPKYTEIKYSADASSYRWEGEDRVIVLKGNVKFVQGDTVVTADNVDYRESTRTAKASGNLKITDPQCTGTGDLCTVNFEKKSALLTGSVRLTAKPKPKPRPEAEKPAADGKVKPLREEWKDEVVVTCDKVEYFYKEKRAEASGNLKFVQKKRVLTADAATYLGREEIVKLSGSIQGHDEKQKHTFSAPKVTVSLKEGQEWVEAEKATGTFYVKDEEEQPAEEKPAEPAPSGKE